MKKKFKKLRIFIGPSEIAGYYSHLTYGLKKLGANIEFVNYSEHPFKYIGKTYNPILIRMVKWFYKLSKISEHPIILRIVYKILIGLILILWSVQALFRYDVFIFSFGRSLLPLGLDLPFIKFFGKKIISNLLHGSEARPSFIDGSYGTEKKVIHKTKYLCLVAKQIRKTVDMHFKFGSIIIGSPFSTSQNAKGKFINYFALGLPIRIMDIKNAVNIKEKKQYKNSKVVRILHSPSNPFAKGTSIINRTINRLKQKGYQIDFVMLRNRTFVEVLEEIKKCDFVIDQVYSDTPMAGFATEAAWFGKPAVVGGYGLERLKEYVSNGMWPPSKICYPDQIEYAIEELILKKKQRLQLGKDAQFFVREKWNALKVAKRFKQLIEGDIPKNWWINPRNVIYLEGCGQSLERTKFNIRKIVSSYGIESLQLSHRPDLENAFMKLADIKKFEKSLND